jgi:hypothetical protein
MFATLHRSPINVLTIVKRPKMSNGISEVHESPQIGFLTRSEEFSRNATLQCLIKIYARRKRFRACIVQDSGKDMLGKAVAEHYCRDELPLTNDDRASAKAEYAGVPPNIMVPAWSRAPLKSIR